MQFWKRVCKGNGRFSVWLCPLLWPIGFECYFFCYFPLAEGIILVTMVDNVMNQLTDIGTTVKLPRDLPFTFSERRADQWEVSTVAQYVAEKMDLPQYTTAIKESYIDGQMFLSFHDRVPLAGLEMTHSLHRVKFSSHAQQLRNEVFRRIGHNIKKQGPKEVKNWAAVDTAFWLASREQVMEGLIYGNHNLLTVAL